MTFKPGDLLMNGNWMEEVTRVKVNKKTVRIETKRSEANSEPPDLYAAPQLIVRLRREDELTAPYIDRYALSAAS